MMHKAIPSREETTTKIQTLLLVLGPNMMRSHVYHEMAFFLVFQKSKQTSEILVPMFKLLCFVNEFNKTNTHFRKADQILCYFVFR